MLRPSGPADLCVWTSRRFRIGLARARSCARPVQGAPTFDVNLCLIGFSKGIDSAIITRLRLERRRLRIQERVRVWTVGWMQNVHRIIERSSVSLCKALALRNGHPVHVPGACAILVLNDNGLSDSLRCIMPFSLRCHGALTVSFKLAYHLAAREDDGRTCVRRAFIIAPLGDCRADPVELTPVV